MKRLARVVALVGVNLLIVFVLLEVLLRISASALPGNIGAAARWVTTGQPFAEQWTPAWQQNRDHFWALRPGLDNVLQYGSPTVSFRMSTVELWQGAGIGFRTDPVDFFVDAVAIGDSFTMCFTERPDCWVDQLSTLTGKRIVNLGQPVTGTTSHLRILRDFGAPMTPPLVIWQFFGNDFNDDYGLAVFRDEQQEISEPVTTTGQDFSAWLRRNLVTAAVLETLVSGRFSAVPDGEQPFVKPYRATFGSSNQHVLQFGGGYEQQALDMTREQNQIGYNLSRQAFTEARELVRTWQGELIVILIPTREEVYRDITEPVMGAAAIDKLVSARAAMLDLCAELELRCMDAYDAFYAQAQQGQALYFSDDMHLNPAGNRVLAEAISAWLAAP